MIKIIYPYINSLWHDDLKYSIRSIEKYFKDPYELWIMGDKPKWMNNNIHHIPYYNKNFKQVNKCRLFDLSQMLPEDEDIIWMNDDIYLLNDVNTNILHTRWNNGFIKPHNNNNNKITNDWYRKLITTINFLDSIGSTTYNFECHIPTVYNIQKLLYTFERFEELDVWTMNTAYFNYNDFNLPLKPVNDVKIGRYKSNRHVDLPPLDNYLFLNHNNDGLSFKLMTIIKAMFPKKSRYEL